MEQYCQNPYCENEAVKDVQVSVDKPSDQRRAVCAACEEAYTWGVQNGCMQSMPEQVWVMVVTELGTVIEAQVVRSQDEAVKSLAAYLRAHEGYEGAADIPGISDWLVEHDERLGVDIFPASQA
jgi:hypothetical protein